MSIPILLTIIMAVFETNAQCIFDVYGFIASTFTGVTLLWHNAWLLILFPVDWIILTVVLKNTEEKWLLNLYGADYAAYIVRVNRCIPIKRFKK